MLTCQRTTWPSSPNAQQLSTSLGLTWQSVCTLFWENRSKSAARSLLHDRLAHRWGHDFTFITSKKGKDEINFKWYHVSINRIGLAPGISNFCSMRVGPLSFEFARRTSAQWQRPTDQLVMDVSGCGRNFFWKCATGPQQHTKHWPVAVVDFSPSSYAWRYEFRHYLIRSFIKKYLQRFDL